MKISNYVTLVICVLAGLFFSVGMCMCLLPEWNLFTLGVILASIGGVFLIAIGVVFYIRKAQTKAPTNWKLIGKIAYAVISALVLGLGMSLIMVWNLMIWGIIVGVIGLIMILLLIPMFFGLKRE